MINCTRPWFGQQLLHRGQESLCCIPLQGAGQGIWVHKQYNLHHCFNFLDRCACIQALIALIAALGKEPVYVLHSSNRTPPTTGQSRPLI